MKFLLLVTLFGRFVADARNLERGDEGRGKDDWSTGATSPVTWGASEITSARWYTPTLPPWTPSSSWRHSKSETCPAPKTLTVTRTEVTTVYTGSVKVITDTTTTTTTINSCTTCPNRPICGGGTTYMNFTHITSGCCNCTAPPVSKTTTTTTTTSFPTCPIPPTCSSYRTCPTCTTCSNSSTCTTCPPPSTTTTTITVSGCCNVTYGETILSGVIYRRSEAYGQLEVIASHTEYALPILILLIIFGLLTLLALAWLIWKMSPRRKEGTCVTCGRPVRECICGT